MRTDNQSQKINKDQKRNSSFFPTQTSPFHHQIHHQKSKLITRCQRAIAVQNPLQASQLFQPSMLNHENLEHQSPQLLKTSMKFSGIQKRPYKKSQKFKRHSSCSNYIKIKHASKLKLSREPKLQGKEISKKSLVLYGLENARQCQNLISVQKKSLRKQYLQTMNAVIKKHRQLQVSTQKTNKQVEFYLIIAQKLRNKVHKPSRQPSMSIFDSKRVIETLKSQKSTDDESLIV